MHELRADRPRRRCVGVDEDGLWHTILPHSAVDSKGYDAFSAAPARRTEYHGRHRCNLQG